MNIDHINMDGKPKMSMKRRETLPSLPPLESMDLVHGYERLSYEPMTFPPPVTISESYKCLAPIREALPSGKSVSEHEAREALVDYVDKRCCYGKRAAKQLAITKIHYSSAFHYTLESFTEKRQVCWAYEPYTNELSTGDLVETESTTAQAPLPWDIHVPIQPLFANQSKTMEVPNTTSQKRCHLCLGVGTFNCVGCDGDGFQKCLHCHGDGTRVSSTGEREQCFFCHGMGKDKCQMCHGTGNSPCKVCQGKCLLKCFIKLTVTWRNNVEDHIVERTNLPEELIKGVSGQVAFEEQLPRVWPINHFPDNTINMASSQLVQKHATSYQNQKILMQRQQVRIIPVTEINYQWKSHVGRFYVYGYENKVYAPDYPQKCCCCGCNVL
ncbi:Protein ssuh2 [Chamberlinius hualienensis]